jgi:phospholipase C
VPPPDPSAATGELGFKFDRSGYRVPAVIVSPWVEPGSVYNEEYRHTSLIATLREKWGLGAPFSRRDAAARTFSSVFARDTARDPETWPAVTPRTVPPYFLDTLALGRTISKLGRAAFEAMREFAKLNNAEIEGLPKDPKAPVPPEQAIDVLRNFAALMFPKLATGGAPLPKPPARPPGAGARRA